MFKRRGDRHGARPLVSLAAWALTGPVALAIATSAPAQQQAEREALRVCADPANLPFSNKQREGYENKIASLLGESLGLPVEYTWYPQQMGFGRNTLKARDEQQDRYKCDLVMGTTSLEVGKTTEPYYASTYTLVYAKGQGLDDVKALPELAAMARENHDLRIGAFTGSPGGTWMRQQAILGNLVSYKSQSGSQEVTPARVVEDVASGEIDAAIVWGPIAGYFAKRSDAAELQVIPLASQPGIPFKYAIAMGVRYGEEQWRRTVEQFIGEHEGEIQDILQNYDVPLVKISEAVQPAGDDDDD